MTILTEQTFSSFSPSVLVPTLFATFDLLRHYFGLIGIKNCFLEKYLNELEACNHKFL